LRKGNIPIFTINSQFAMNLSHLIDLRSDTVTQPTPQMLDAMMQAKVGDDVFGDDPTVSALETKAATMFGMEAALFCTSGTMTNQLAIRVHCSPGSEVICDQMSHIYLYEGGGVAVNALSSVKTVVGDRGRITAEQVAGAINNPNDIHLPVTRLVSLENTMNRGGGCIYDFNEFGRIKSVCQKNGLKMHLDGARLFNALIETNETPADYGQVFDSISICLSKGLGCPVGSLLIGDRATINQARRFRKLMGGGWRQAGFLAAAGIFALDHQVSRLKDDHRRAKEIGKLFENHPQIEAFPIETNIVILSLSPLLPVATFIDHMRANGVLCVPFGKQMVRFVTHLGITDDDIDKIAKAAGQNF
jgi:threonine aldolase